MVTRARMDVELQFNDVWMSECPHVIHLSLNPRFGLGLVDDLFRYEFHRYSVTCDSMECHCSKNVRKARQCDWYE